jgi:hypothetical protein
MWGFARPGGVRVGLHWGHARDGQTQQKQQKHLSQKQPEAAAIMVH